MELKKELNRFYYSTALCDLRLMNQSFEDETITYNSLLYLELIFTMNGKCTVSKIAELLYISKPAVTLKINELVKKGWVVKTLNLEDRRQNFLSINEEMMPAYKIYRRQDDLAVKKISRKYSTEDIEKFCDMLHMISDINFEEMK